MSDPYERAAVAATEIRTRTGVERHDVAIVLGSGWADAAGALGTTTAEMPLAALPGFPAPTVSGHAGMMRSVSTEDATLLLLAGRSHLYEGHSPDVVVHGVRSAVLAGCEHVILTNAAGSLNAQWPPGTPVLISDQLNLTGATPMSSEPPAELGSRFVDCTNLYDRAVRERVRAHDPTLPEGVYAGLLGGAYETPAEIRMLRTLGADLVGMSTVLEAIAARHLGAVVIGISLVSNLAAGMSSTGLDHREVLATGRSSAARMVDVLALVLRSL